MPAIKHPPKSLLQFVEDLENDIHLDPSDEKVAKILKDNFSPDALVFENETILKFEGFTSFVKEFRKQFIVLQIKDSKAVVFKADHDGLGGVVGFASTFLFKQKSDGQLSTGDTIEIFEVTFFPGEGKNGKRLVTKASAAIGERTNLPDFKPVKMTTKSTRGKKRATNASRVSPKRGGKVPAGVTKKRSSTRLER